MDVIALPGHRMDALTLERLQPREFYRQWLETSAGLRPDGRSFEEPRQLAIAAGSIGTAEGGSLSSAPATSASATVKLGSTMTIAGIKCEVAEPPPANVTGDNQNGHVVVNLHFAPGASASARPGAPTDREQALSLRLNDLLFSSRAIPLQQLDIVAGKLVWAVYVDVLVLSDDGNIFEAGWIAMLAALMNLWLPRVELDEDSGVVKITEFRAKKLEIACLPLPMTAAIYDDKTLLCDPNAKEEALVERSLVHVLFDARSPRRLYYMSKPGGGVFLNSGHLKSLESLVLARHSLLIRSQPFASFIQ